MEKYDPATAPDPDEWLAMDESERIALERDYHRRARVKMPSLGAHAAFHAIVENQIALGDDIPVRRTLQRLMGEGLDRHDAIHAIGSVLAGHIHDLIRNAVSEADPNASYFRELERLTAESWRRSG